MSKKQLRTPTIYDGSGLLQHAHFIAAAARNIGGTVNYMSKRRGCLQ
jgi:hypothetical protein